jgi:hypothetical protein
VAEDGGGAFREDGGHPAAVLGQLGAADGVHARMDRVQPALTDPVLDALPREPKRKQLPPSDDPVLPPREVPGE